MSTNLQTTLNTHKTTIHSFFIAWLDRQQALLQKLLDITNSNDEQNEYEKLELIDDVLAHYTEYFEENARVLLHDGFLLMSPPWLTSVEKTFLWCGGLKPSLAIGLVEMFITSNQIQTLEPLRDATFKEERRIMDELAMVQESVAAQPILNFCKSNKRLVEPEIANNNSSEIMHELNLSMARIVQRADNLRRKTVMMVLEILSVDQKLKFLAAIGKHQLGIRDWGFQNDGHQ